MRNREIILWTVIIALVGGIILYILLSRNQSYFDLKSVNISANQFSTSTGDNINNVTPKNNISQNHYTLSEVSKHNNQLSCWTIIDSNIYDITSFISSHPAGINKILRGCGVDATNMYGRVGAHDISRLTDFVVGIVK
jgi:cytochrome b involved in lipid metabolism